MNPRYPVVWFDLDHTLFDSDACMELAFATTAEAHGLGHRSEELHAELARVNAPLWRLVEQGELALADLNNRRFELLAAATSLSVDAEAMATDYLHWLGHLGELFPGAVDVLEALAPHCSLGLVTNGYGVVQRARLDIHELDRFFDVVVVSGEIGIAKPDPAFFDVGLDQLRGAGHHGVTTDEILVVGDSLTSDMAGALASDMATCWFNPHGKAQPADQRFDWIVESLQELPSLLLET